MCTVFIYDFVEAPDCSSPDDIFERQSVMPECLIEWIVSRCVVYLALVLALSGKAGLVR